MKDGENLYVGVPQKDGTIGVEGPLSEENFKRKQRNEDDTVIGVSAENKGSAILKIVINSINSDRSKSDR